MPINVSHVLTDQISLQHFIFTLKLWLVIVCTIDWNSTIGLHVTRQGTNWENSKLISNQQERYIRRVISLLHQSVDNDHSTRWCVKCDYTTGCSHQSKETVGSLTWVRFQTQDALVMKLIKLDNVRVRVTQCSAGTRLSRLEAGYRDCELQNFLYSRAGPTRPGPAR